MNSIADVLRKIGWADQLRKMARRVEKNHKYPCVVPVRHRHPFVWRRWCSARNAMHRHRRFDDDDAPS